jgi:hypothetical protein
MIILGVPLSNMVLMVCADVPRTGHFARQQIIAYVRHPNLKNYSHAKLL